MPLKHVLNLFKRRSLFVPNVIRSISTRGWSCFNGSYQKYTKRGASISWRYYSGNRFIPSYYRTSEVFIIFETPEHKFRCHFSKTTIPRQNALRRRVAIEVVFLSLKNCVSRFCVTTPRCAHERQYYPCVFAFVWFSFWGIILDDLTTDDGE